MTLEMGMQQAALVGASLEGWAAWVRRSGCDWLVVSGAAPPRPAGMSPWRLRPTEVCTLGQLPSRAGPLGPSWEARLE